MPIKVIELNDSCLRVGDENGIISKTSGFALLAHGKVIVGDHAERRACLQPTDIFSKYWQELSLEPISHGPGIRHYADLAYAQLLDIAEGSSVDGDVILSVPSSFTRQQLEILLGLSKQCPFKVVGLVDSALLAAVATGSSSHVIYADMHLHQLLLTELSITNGHLVIESVTQLPGVGIQNFKNLMMQMATDLFINQCRFNPQHNAHSEQQLYNELSSWFFHDEMEQTLFLELKSGDAIHTVKLPKETLVSSLSGYYKKINDSINELMDSNTKLLLSESLGGLPGYISTIPRRYDRGLLDHDRMIKACYEYDSLIIDDREELQLITKFPAEKIGVVQAPDKSARRSVGRPTHILCGNRAIKIDDIDIKNSVGVQWEAEYKNIIYMNLQTPYEQLGSISKRDGVIYIKCYESEVFLNGSLIIGEHSLTLGDHLQFTKQGEFISLIEVDDGE